MPQKYQKAILAQLGASVHTSHPAAPKPIRNKALLPNAPKQGQGRPPVAPAGKTPADFTGYARAERGGKPPVKPMGGAVPMPFTK